MKDSVENLSAEARLELFRRALDHSPDGLVVVDRETMTIIDANETAAARVGLRRAEYIGTKVPRMQQNQTPEQLAATYDEVIAMAPEVQRREREMRGVSGVYPVEVTRRAVRIDGRWLLLVCLRDITEKKRAEQEIARRMAELVRSNEELERFAYVASHDLSEPLRLVASFAQLLERRYKSQLGPDGQEFIGFVVDGVTRMKHMIDDLLAYSRVGHAGQEATEVDMNEVAADVLRLLQALIARTGAQVVVGDLPTLTFNRLAMSQLLQNLIANGIKFRGPDTAPRIEVRAQEQANEWVLTVQDNGIGIEPQYSERIFQLFQRLHGPTAFEGTGIGLAICKKIVEQHGGRIWVESQPGAGSAFRFTIPKQPG